MDQSLFQFLLDEAEMRPMTVSELNADVRAIVERGFPSVWVEGEVVNFLRAASGHWYFTLNDGTSQLKCVVWKTANFRIRFRPENGMTVRVRGRLTFWETKGELKLTAESLEPAGEGALRAAFEQIKARLEAEGLFDESLKRPIPYFPRRVAVVTSQTGAAYHDICTVLTRRAKSVSLLLVPTIVQGEGAASNIRRALIALNKFNLTLEPASRIDVVIIGRGGGSAEDLWAFNDEALARAMRLSEIPVISAVGHEIDWTISDLVADLRAATPSAAAELVAGREDEIHAMLDAREGQLRSLLDYKRLGLDGRINDATAMLRSGFEAVATNSRMRFAAVTSRLSPVVLDAKRARLTTRLDAADRRRDTAIHQTVAKHSERLNIEMASLDALSPLGVLTRGYSIAQNAEGHVVRDSSQVKSGDKLKIRLERGKLETEVLSVES